MTKLRMFDVIRTAITIPYIKEAIIGMIFFQPRYKSQLLTAVTKIWCVKPK